MSTKTDVSKLLDLLKARVIVTAKEARDSGIQSPAARARELAEHGFRVVPCWRLLDPHKLQSQEGTRRNKANTGAIKSVKNRKATTEAIAAELERARAALNGGV